MRMELGETCHNDKPGPPFRFKILHPAHKRVSRVVGLGRSGSFLGWPSGLNFPDLFSPLEFKNSRSFRSTLLATLPF